MSLILSYYQPAKKRAAAPSNHAVRGQTPAAASVDCGLLKVKALEGEISKLDAEIFALRPVSAPTQVPQNSTKKDQRSVPLKTGHAASPAVSESTRPQGLGSTIPPLRPTQAVPLSGRPPLAQLTARSASERSIASSGSQKRPRGKFVSPLLATVAASPPHHPPVVGAVEPRAGKGPEAKRVCPSLN